MGDKGINASSFFIVFFILIATFSLMSAGVFKDNMSLGIAAYAKKSKGSSGGSSGGGSSGGGSSGGGSSGGGSSGGGSSGGGGGDNNPPPPEPGTPPPPEPGTPPPPCTDGSAECITPPPPPPPCTDGSADCGTPPPPVCDPSTDSNCTPPPPPPPPPCDPATDSNCTPPPPPPPPPCPPGSADCTPPCDPAKDSNCQAPCDPATDSNCQPPPCTDGSADCGTPPCLSAIGMICPPPPPPPPPPKCKTGEHYDSKLKKCVPDNNCPPGFHLEKGVCTKNIVIRVKVETVVKNFITNQPTVLLLLDTAQLCQLAGDTQCVAKQNQFNTLNLITKIDSTTKTWIITGQVENRVSKIQRNVQVIAYFYDSKGNNVGGPYKGIVNPTVLKSLQLGVFSMKPSMSIMKGTPSFIRLEYQSAAS